jgi:disulfide oxidoreductase YuzD
MFDLLLAHCREFRWGPVRQATLVDTETTLASTFATPNTTNAADFLSAAYYLRYSSSLFVVREIDSSAYNANAAGFRYRCS